MERVTSKSKRSFKGKNKKTAPQGLKGKPMNQSKKRNEVRNQMYKSKMGNQAEGQGFANQRKVLMQHKYKKLLRKEQLSLDSHSKKVQEVYMEMDASNPTKTRSAVKERGKLKSRSEEKKRSRFFKAEVAFRQKVEESDRKTQEAEKQKEDREKALSAYTHKKKLQHKKLLKKNFRGQPVMASQMELLLKKLESNKS